MVFLQTEEPFWLQEAYSSAISSLDTGIVQRNIDLSKFVTLFIYLFFDGKKQFLDFAGGHGLFVRMMRDIGFDFYWQDLYAENIFAKDFEFDKHLNNIALITSFESFEHFVEPMKEIKNMLKVSDNILFSTALLPDPIPNPKDWWYYALESGQHIAFYSLKNLRFIADKFELNLYSWGSIHFFTKFKLNKIKLKFLNYYKRDLVFNFLRKRLKSKTINDMSYIKNKLNEINEDSF